MKYTTVVKNEKSKNKRDILKNILCNALYKRFIYFMYYNYDIKHDILRIIFRPF